MNLTLVVETSSIDYNLVLGNSSEIIFDSRHSNYDLDSKDLSSCLSFGLNFLNKKISDIGDIVVNIGPGGLSSVRGGVAFANGLSFSLAVPMVSYTSFDLLGYEAWKVEKSPVVCSIPASQGNVYLGLYHVGKVVTMRYGSPRQALESIITSLHEIDTSNKITIAGKNFSDACDILSGYTVKAVANSQCEARTFIEMRRLGLTSKLQLSCAIPLNEQSEVFYESSKLRC